MPQKQQGTSVYSDLKQANIAADPAEQASGGGELMGAHTHTPTHTPCHHTIWTHLCRVAVYCGIIKASLNHEQPLIKAGNGGRDCDVCMIGIVRMCGWGGGVTRFTQHLLRSEL